MPIHQQIFTFGSNLAGIHGAGAAYVAAKKHGAEMGVGQGMTGNSYALPTKDHNIQTLPFPTVAMNIHHFLVFAKRNPEYQFKVTRIGCGLAGYQDKEIAPLFYRAPDNCHFDLAWRPFLGDKKMYWGSW